MGNTCNDGSSIKVIFLLLKRSAVSETAISQIINPSELIFQRNLVCRVFHAFVNREVVVCSMVLWSE